MKMKCSRYLYFSETVFAKLDRLRRKRRRRFHQDSQPASGSSAPRLFWNGAASGNMLPSVLTSPCVQRWVLGAGQTPSKTIKVLPADAGQGSRGQDCSG